MTDLPALSHTLRQASVHTAGDRLIVSTGRVERIWRWTNAGLASCALTELTAGRRWESEALPCAWQLPGGSEPAGAELRQLVAAVSDDEGFTSEHLCVTADIAYPAAGVLVRLLIWAYPQGSGVRTQLGVQWLSDEAASTAGERQRLAPPPARVECLPPGPVAHRRRLIGYNSGTQDRNDTHESLLQEEVITHPLRGREWCDWASAICVEDDAGGMALVKESHKCANARGHDTGGFVVDEREGLSCNGLGVLLPEISTERLMFGWATWSLAWAGGTRARQHAFKTFDRLRFPLDPKRDVYIQANTWGSGWSGAESRLAAGAASVLEELSVCQELGIDVLQIDDGWQVPPGASDWKPGERGWRPHPESYPENWAPVRAAAARRGVRLGLWAAAEPIGLEELQETYEQGGFVQYKLDFAHLRTRGEIDALMQKVRTFIRWTGHRVRVNWDLTEIVPRYGYFFGREYGPVYLENRKPARPWSTVYRPHTVLRDVWQLAHYVNLHRFQCTIQDVERVDRERSDAHVHSQQYAVAIALLGIPLFFLQTKLLSDAARAEVREILGIYRAHREALYRGLTDPLGDRPDNASWTGFQSHEPGADHGYLMIFRERCNEEPTRRMRLVGLPPGPVRMTDLLRNITTEVEPDAGGTAPFHIPAAPGFLFLRYQSGRARG